MPVVSVEFHSYHRKLGFKSKMRFCSIPTLRDLFEFERTYNKRGPLAC